MKSKGRTHPAAPARAWVKTIFALLLLPLCFGVAQAVVRLVQVTGRAETVWVALAAGAACWWVVYLSLPKPMWAYVLGHELTHALWAWIFGARVKRIKVSSKGGHVVLTHSNAVITLAPYFFPIYAAGVAAFFAVGDWAFGWGRYLVWFHLLLGAAYAFHVTLTWSILSTRQSDITDQGYFFSAVVIWLGNASVFLIGISLVTGRVGLLTALGWCWTETGEVFLRLARLL